MRSVFMSLLVFATVAEAQMGHDLRPALGVDAPQGYESVAASDGSGLPPGSGTAQSGREIYLTQCAACHGADGRLRGHALVGGQGTLSTSSALKTVGSYWPYATTLFDYVKRAMPYGNEKTLSDSQVYAVTAYVLHLNGLLALDVQLSAETLTAVEMLNRDGFVRAQLP